MVITLIVQSTKHHHEVTYMGNYMRYIYQEQVSALNAWQNDILH